MALHGSAPRRSPDNPLAGVLRDLDRRTRSIEHQPKSSPEPGPRGETGPPGPQGDPGPPGPSPAATVAVTDRDGRATWTFDVPLATSPVVSAVAADPGHGERGPLTVTVEEATETSVVVRVWRTRPVLGLGLLPAVPAAGVDVHLMATARAGAPAGETGEGY
ncbi:hypothetical protein ACFRCI_30585 [Streptomyces sp. NPDC056638]|uniref:hypothetical protein n=1 Tax=Streptomyces sp. NPDC056638 TaxID=3345887 RepID=UPI0036AA27EA